MLLGYVARVKSCKGRHEPIKKCGLRNLALLQKPPVIWYKDQFTADRRSLETCHERSVPL